MQIDAQTQATSPAGELRSIFLEEIDTASMAVRRGQRVYQSVKKLSELIGGEYGDRVIYELIQNAHDAQPDGQPGKILVRLEIRGDAEGTLYVANAGTGFSLANVQAIRNIATSTKEIGEGIGNKGVGFRSVEALTDDVRIYSRLPGSHAARFNGFCFRFARPEEVKQAVMDAGFADEATEVARSLPRYLAAVPVDDHRDAEERFASLGYATLVELPLRTTAAVTLARAQYEELTGSDAPLHLFLDRIEALDFEIDEADRFARSSLTRTPLRFREPVSRLDDCWIEHVELGPNGRRWLLVRYALGPERVKDAVERSIPFEQLMTHWLDWKGRAIVSVGLPLDGRELDASRLYTFLPMAAETGSPALMHIDAPFFTSIDRRRAKLDLPLNAELLNAVAEASAAAAIHLAERHSDSAERLSVDLAAWDVKSWPRLKRAFDTIGVPFGEAPIWPTSARTQASFEEIRTWPEGKYKFLTPARVARQAGAVLLASSLSPEREARILALAKASGVSIESSPAQIADWIERIAGQMPRRSSSSKNWADFCSDIAVALPTPERLKACVDKVIFFGRDGNPLIAGSEVYVRQDGGRRGNIGGSPPPPADISRKLTILSDRIPLRAETFTAFERAGLCRRYVATEILRQLPTLFGARPAPARRASALEWAFRVWQQETAAAQEILSEADLHVPTSNGWQPAAEVAFSGDWTQTGKTLEEFLVEAASAGDTDARDAAARLLASWENWSGRQSKDSRAEWIRFLADAGVTDGLIPIPTEVPKGPLDGSSWRYKLPAEPVLKAHAAWREETGLLSPNHPYTSYWRRGEAWRMPGQVIVSSLSDEARKNFATLIVHHLRLAGDVHFHFTIGRYDRGARDHDARKVVTPFCSFLKSAAWFPVTHRGEERFIPVSQAWLLNDRRNDPRFVERVADYLAEHIGRDGRAFDVLTKPPLSLRIWKEPVYAHPRLAALARVAGDLQAHERAPFRRQYDLGWRELLETKVKINPKLPIVIDRVGSFESMVGNENRPRVYVRTGRDPMLARLLAESGEAVLLTGDDIDGERVIDVLNQSGCFDAKAVEQSELRLVVDGEPFLPQMTEPPIVEYMPWLLDAMVVAHEVGARELERSIQSQTLESQFSRIRLRVAADITLQSSAGIAKPLVRHIFRDGKAPTLLVRGTFDRQQLMDSAADISTLVHGNLRSFEPMLLRLVMRLPDDMDLRMIAPPSMEDLAFAAQVPVDRVEEALSYRRTDRTGHVRLVLPVIAYFADGDNAAVLRDTLFDTPLEGWARLLAPAFMPVELAAQLLGLIEKTEDPAVIRRDLGLDYRRFNDALRSVSQQSLVNEGELRRRFEFWKGVLSTGLVERIRRHFASTWSEPDDLARYQEMRRLDWLDFDPEWVENLETITREIVEDRADALLAHCIGEDSVFDLPTIEALHNINRRAAMTWYGQAFPILRAVASSGLAPAWWAGAGEIVAVLSSAGLFDFEPLDDEQLIKISALAGLWPSTVEMTLDPDKLGIRPEEIDREKREAEQARQADIVRRNSVAFGDTSFNTADPDFIASFSLQAFDLFKNSGWRERSNIRTVNLKEQTDPNRYPGGGGGAGGRQVPKPPETVRVAIGLAGELLAYHYLKVKHGALFRDACWVSRNRESMFSEKGSDDWGFDFRVETSETTWFYEVKATPGDLCEFEMTDNEYRRAAAMANDKRQRYRVLMVQHVFDTARCKVLELPNPAGEDRSLFRRLGQHAVRLRFDVRGRD